MAFKLDRADRRSLAIAGVVFILLVEGALIFAPETNTTRELPTTYSTASGGAKAVWLLLRESGYRVERWERPPTDLPDPAGTLLILADPGAFPGERERRALKDFALGGGRIMAVGAQAAMCFPDAGISIEPISANTWKQVPAIRPSAITRAAPW
ncbi:MAG TPA: DUF4350 domain-containing protein, partial [Dongiaceae bacterium]|nr:DUF4350 domain-containing protein [Dongiaceae bacterium]